MSCCCAVEPNKLVRLPRQEFRKPSFSIFPFFVHGNGLATSNLLVTKADKFGSLQAPAGEQYWLFFWVEDRGQAESSMCFLLLAGAVHWPQCSVLPKGDPGMNCSDGRMEEKQCHRLIFKIPGFIAGWKPSSKGQMLCDHLCQVMI